MRKLCSQDFTSTLTNNFPSNDDAAKNFYGGLVMADSREKISGS